MNLAHQLSAVALTLVTVVVPVAAKAQIGNAFLYHVNRSLEESNNPLRYSVSDLEKMKAGIVVCESLDSWASVQSLMERDADFVATLDTQEERDQAVDFLAVINSHAVYQKCPQHLESLDSYLRSFRR